MLCQCASTHQSLSSKQTNKILLSYVIEPIVENGENKFKVDLYFKGTASGKDTIILPSTWAGHTHLEKTVVSLKGLSQKTEILPTAHDNIKSVTHPPNQRVHLQYIISDKLIGNLYASQRYYRMIFDEKYFHFFGGTFFVRPDWNPTTPVKLSLNWIHLPKGWQLSNTFGTNEFVQVLTLPIHQLIQGIYVGGDFRLYKRTIKSNPVFIAIRGQWKFSDDEFIELIIKSIAIQRDFWNDHHFPYYLVSLIPTGTQCCQYSGAGMETSFTSFVSSNRGIDFNFIQLVNHEIFHTWLGNKIQREDPEELYLWLSEGFSDYFARLMSLRAGLISLNDYINSYNGDLKKYYFSTARHITNNKIPQNFWQNRSVNNIPYLRGDILAHLWNHKLYLQSNGKDSLDSILQNLLKEAQWHGARISATSFVNLLPVSMQEDVKRDILKFIDMGELIEPLPHFMGPCISLNTNTINVSAKETIEDNKARMHWGALSTWIEEFVPKGTGKTIQVNFPQYHITTAPGQNLPDQCMDYFR